MFPLGSVLFPHMPLPLKLFEPRYLRMLGDLLDDPSPAFGVVLIERGHEVGGGDQRFGVGTMAEILQVEAYEGFMAVLARGADRFEVSRWLPDEPYPRAETAAVPALQWEPRLQPRRVAAETLVRQALAALNELPEAVMDFTLAESEVAACWQLAGLAPVGEIDQLRMLRAESMAQLLDLVCELTASAMEAMRFGRP